MNRIIYLHENVNPLLSAKLISYVPSAYEKTFPDKRERERERDIGAWVILLQNSLPHIGINIS